MGKLGKNSAKEFTLEIDSVFKDVAHTQMTWCTFAFFTDFT